MTEVARARGVVAVRAMTTAGNTALRKVLEATGFQPHPGGEPSAALAWSAADSASAASAVQGAPGRRPGRDRDHGRVEPVVHYIAALS